MPIIGYIGLGIMGKSIARNILKAGFPLVVHNRSREAVHELVAEGAGEAFSPAEVAERTDFIFTNLPDSPDVEQVVVGARGITETAHTGQIFIDNSTIKPALARSIAARLKQKGIQALDAPVSGDEISFTEMQKYQSQEVKIVYKGKVSGDEIKFTRNVADMANEEFVAKRAK